MALMAKTSDVEVIESGIEMVRRAVRVANMTRESSFDGFSAEECLRLISACWASKWDVLPDDLLLSERIHAASHGRLSEAAERRLASAFSLEPFLLDLNGDLVRVRSLDHAAELWCEARDREGWGASEMTKSCGVVRDDVGKLVGRISYNGRIEKA